MGTKSESSRTSSHLAAAFADAQRSFSAHARARSVLSSSMSTDYSGFLTSFIHCVNRILVVSTRDPPVERLVDFVGFFTASTTAPNGQDESTLETTNFCLTILQYLIGHTRATGPAVRFRVLQIIASILRHLPEEPNLDEEIWDPLFKAILDRADDKVPRIRAAAALALTTLQNPDAQSDPVANKLCEMMELDSSPAVRKTAMSAVTGRLQSVVQRAGDVSPDVRKATYSALGRQVHPKEFTVECRITLLKNGLQDRDKLVRQACKITLLKEGWFDGACESDPVQLAKLLDVEANEEVALQALKECLHSSDDVDFSNVDINCLNKESALVLRSLAHSKHSAQVLEKILPSLTIFGDALCFYKENPFEVSQLLETTQQMDLGDEVGRRKVAETVRLEFLADPTVSSSVLASAVRALRLTLGSESDSNRALVEILEIVSSSDHPKSTAVEGLKPTENSNRALVICEELMKSTSRTSTGFVTLVAALQDVALPLLSSSCVSTRSRAMKCLGWFCLADRSTEATMRFIPLVMQACDADAEPVRIEAYKILIDVVMVHNDIRLNLGTSEAAPSQYVCDRLIGLVASPSTSLRNLAVEGLAKLVFSQRIPTTDALLMLLIQQYFHPGVDNRDALRQCLAVFFPAFCFSSKINQTRIANLYLPVLQSFLRAPLDSPLSDVSGSEVADYMIFLTDPGPEAEEGRAKSDQCAHSDIAERVLMELFELADDDAEESRLLSRSLSSLRFSCMSENLLESLQSIANKTTALIQDKRSRTHLEKFARLCQEEVEGRVESSSEDTEELPDVNQLSSRVENIALCT